MRNTVMHNKNGIIRFGCKSESAFQGWTGSEYYNNVYMRRMMKLYGLKKSMLAGTSFRRK
jgi:hypothetical protein